MTVKGKGNRTEQKKRYKLNHPDKVKAEKKRYALNHPDKILEIKRRYNLNRRLKVISHYSNGILKCAHCGETHIEFLEVSAGVNTEKEETSVDLYSTLIREHFPDGCIVLCSNCNLKRIRKNAYYTKGVGGTLEQKKWYNRDLKIRLNVLNHYSLEGKIKCACCGTEDIDTLCMDHKNGDGNEHRKIVSASSMFRWIMRNDYPDTFRILCANCNQSLGTRGYCPHGNTGNDK